jgi:hypothetical protein
MTASLSDILTTQKNGVVGVNGIAQASLRALGSLTSITVTSETVIYTGIGYLVNFSVVVAGTTAGKISNASAASPAASTALCVVPTTVGVFKTGQVFTTGIVVTPGTGQSINVTYSPG